MLENRPTIALATVLALAYLFGYGPAATAGGPGPETFESLDEEFSQINGMIPGFGGLFYDRDGRPTVYLTDPAEPGAAALLGPDVRVLPGEFEFRQLRSWRHDLRPALLGRPGVVLLDVDETTNRIRVGVEPGHLATTRLGLAVEAARRGIPGRAVVVEEVEPIVRLTTLRDQVRPVPGGVEIASGDQFQGLSVCTLGFNATRDGVSGFVVNSHCTDRWGGGSGTVFYQPLTIPQTGAIGTETVDPEYRRGLPGCPGGRHCRYSDTAFAAYDTSDLSDFGRIARTTSRDTASGSLTIDPADPSFTIVSTSSSAVGHEVNKIGRTTGWTYGDVASTCADVAVSGTKRVHLCQDTVNAGVDSGDSGSPVFSWDGGDTVSLRGILWGGNESGTLFVYSPYANIVRSDELGPLTVH